MCFEETRDRGLVIKDAYFGLAEHIYHIEAGMAPGSDDGSFVMPENIDAYKSCQVIPVAEQLQLLVEASSLELTQELLKPRHIESEN